MSQQQIGTVRLRCSGSKYAAPARPYGPPSLQIQFPKFRMQNIEFARKSCKRACTPASLRKCIRFSKWMEEASLSPSTNSNTQKNATNSMGSNLRLSRVLERKIDFHLLGELGRQRSDSVADQKACIHNSYVYLAPTKGVI